MGLGQLLRPSMRAIQDPGWNLWAKGFDAPGGAAYAGERVNRESALQLLTVYACQSFISETIATMPVDTYRRNSDGTQDEVTPPAWLSGQANPETSTLQFIQQSLISLLGDGNAFWVPIRGARNEVLEAWVLDPLRVEVTRRQGQVVYLVDGVQHRGEILHIPAFVLPGCLRGLNPIEVARRAIGLGLAAQKFGANFFANGSIPSVVLSVPGDPPDDQLKLIRENWVRAHGNGSNLPAVVTGGGSVTPITIAPENAQFLETRSYSAAEIAAQLYRVDPTELGIKVEGSTITYQNIEQRSIATIRKTFLPWIVRLEDAMSRFTPRGQYVKLNTASYLRADTITRYQSYAIGLQQKFLTVDEVREKEDLPPIDPADLPPLQVDSIAGLAQDALPVGEPPQ